MNEKNDNKDDKVPIKTLVLSGGGVKGFAYIGAFKKLKELNKLNDLKHIISVSIGSVFGLLYIVGYEYDELYEEFVNKDLGILLDYKLSNFLKHYGFNTGKVFMSWLETLLLKKGISKDITFKQLYNINPIKYTVTATNLNTYLNEEFNYENNPKMKVLKAIRMCVSLPIMLTKQKYKNNYYIDGGLKNNLPMYLAEQDYPGVLALRLKACNEEVDTNIQNRNTIDSMDKYIYHLCNCFFNIRLELPEKYNKYVININIYNIDSFNWNISYEKRIDLIECGYKSVEEYYVY